MQSQMSDDIDGPASKRLKTESSLDFDLSALNDLPDALLTSQTMPASSDLHQPAASSGNESFLTGLLNTPISSSIGTHQMAQNRASIYTPNMSHHSSSVAVKPSTTSTPFTNHHHQPTPFSGTSLPISGPSLSISGPGLSMNGPGLSINGPSLPMSSNGSLHSLSTMSTLQVQPSQPPIMLQMNGGVHPRTSSQPLVSAVRPQIQRPPMQRSTLGGAMLSPTTGQTSLTNDPSKRKLITQQLVLLLHAHKCQKRIKEGPHDTGDDVCNLHHCKTMKKALQHMSQCQLGRRCAESHCVSSRQIIAHWKNCTNPTCPVCLPLKAVSQKKRQNAAGPALSSGSTGATAAVASTNSMLHQLIDQRQIPNLPNRIPNGGNAVPTSVVHGEQQARFTQLLTNQPTVSRQLSANHQGAPHRQQSMLQSQLGSPTTIHIPVTISSQTNVSQQLAAQTVARPLGTLGTLGTVSQGQAVSQSLTTAQQPAQQPAQLINVDEMKRAYAALGLEYNPNSTPPSAHLSQPLQRQESASPQIRIQKEWHSSVDPNIRKVLITKLVHAIFPSPDPKVLSDPRMSNLVQYAKKVEVDTFTLANNVEDYYQKLAEKIYKIRRELEEKRRQRQRQELQSQAAKAMMDPKNDPMLVDAGAKAFKATVQPKQDPMLADTKIHIKPEVKPEVKSEPLSFSTCAMGDDSFPSPKSESSSIQSFSTTKTLLRQPLVKIKQEPTNPVAKADTSSSSSASPAAMPPAAPTVPKKVVPVKIWRKEELKSALLPIVVKLLEQEEAMPFRQPVDPVTLHIPDYFEIVKKPMDLSTMQSKLEKGQYKCPWEFTNDAWQMFDNAWLYNKKTSKVYKWCSKLSEVFEGEIGVTMKKLGYCCGSKYVFYPNVLVCYGKQTLACTIAQYQVYYAYENRYTFCDKCFVAITTETVELTDELTGNPLTLRKDEFVKTKNDILEPEPLTKCRDCERKFHAVCVQHMDEIWESGYLCDGCLKERDQKKKENRYSAKRLPRCKLSIAIEDRVNFYLTKKGIVGAGEVVIRILSFTEKEAEIKQGMKEKFPEMAATIPYRCKALFAFQYCQQQARDVCFFSMHVQEYDSNAPAPNTSRVYISYLDSIHFFTPREYRTAVYHEILIGYFDYVRVLGFNWGHIWACPPTEGDDYIFHAHPPEQKVPKPKRLQEWYKKMLDKAIIEGVVSDYKDLYKDAIEKNMSSASELPYFEGDFWTTILEDCVKECQDEESKRSLDDGMDTTEVEEVIADDASTSTALVDSPLTGSVGVEGATNSPASITAVALANKQKKLKGNKTKQLKKNSSKKLLVGSDLSAKLFTNMEKHKDMFFVIRLKNRPYNSPGASPNTSDPDSLLSSELMDARDSFLTMCREKHWEFSSLRRAIYSTMAFLYEIHTTNRDGGFVYTCNACKAQVETRYHCPQCEDFDLCVPCYGKYGHKEHKMEKLGLGLTEGTDQADSKLSPAETRKRSLQRCIDSLVHASQCRDANCKLAVCEKMKRVVSHTKMCKRKTTGGCPICKQLITLCCYHAKICREGMCPVPFCNNIKNKFKQQQNAQRVQQDRQLQRRMANMKNISQTATAVGVGVASAPVRNSVGTAAVRNGVLARQLGATTLQTQPGAQQRAVSTTPISSNTLLTQHTAVYTQHSPQQQQQQQQQQHQRVPQQRALLNNQSLLQAAPIGLPQNQSQQLQQLQREQQIRSTAVAAVPQPIVLNQGTQNVQVVRPLQHPRQHPQQLPQQSSQQQPTVTVQTQHPQLVQQQQGLPGQSQSQSPNSNLNDRAKQAAKQKIQRILAALQNGSQQTPEEKQQLLALVKTHPALLQTILKQKQNQQLKQQQLKRQQVQQQQGGMVRSSLVQQHLMSSGSQAGNSGNSLVSRAQPQIQQIHLSSPSQLPQTSLAGLQSNNRSDTGQDEETPPSATEELSRFVDSL